jgi:uncharacterized RmlC-like cupin family protein
MKLLSPFVSRSADAGLRCREAIPARSLAGVARLLTPEAERLRSTLSVSRRSWAKICATPMFEAWVISWPPGGSIEFHDHGGSSAAVQVISGILEETRILRLRHGSCSMRTSFLRPGGASEIPSGCIHDIVNSSDVAATSIHVYSPRLCSMTYYRLDDGALEQTGMVRYDY